jgi:hypothetical protein
MCFVLRRLERESGLRKFLAQHSLAASHVDDGGILTHPRQRRLNDRLIHHDQTCNCGEHKQITPAQAPDQASVRPASLIAVSFRVAASAHGAISAMSFLPAKKSEPVKQ